MSLEPKKLPLRQDLIGLKVVALEPIAFPKTGFSRRLRQIPSGARGIIRQVDDSGESPRFLVAWARTGKKRHLAMVQASQIAPA